MFKLTFKDLLVALKEQGVDSNSQSIPNGAVEGVSTDSRGDNLKGTLFIPLKGENFDGHKFIAAACKKNVSAVLYDQWDHSWAEFKDEVFFIPVKDTLKALQELGTFWRNRLSPVVLGLTGSNGKTTTKDFLGQILGAHYQTLINQGSYNNHWGVPLTLLQMSEETEIVVCEMGMNHPGEIRDLVEIAQPNWVGCTNVGKAHYGHFKNVEEIAKAKEEIYQFASPDSKFVFNLDNVYTKKFFEQWSTSSSKTFSLSDSSGDVFFESIQSTEEGFVVKGRIGGVEGQGLLRAWGRQNVENLAAASALALGVGLEPTKIWEGLSRCSTGWGRNQWIETNEGGAILFDGYNANPESFGALLRNLLEFESERSSLFGVFGEMLELGDKASMAHRELGQLAASLPWKSLAFVGPSSASFAEGFGQRASGKNKECLVISSTYEELLDSKFPSVLEPGALLVVKGSRGLRLERWVIAMGCDLSKG